MTITDAKDRVRLTISDVGGEDGESFLFSNEEVETFLDMRNGNVLLAAALALRTIAGNETQVAKRIQFLELQTDGPAVANSLRTLATELEQVAHEVAGVRIAAASS